MKPTTIEECSTVNMTTFNTHTRMYTHIQMHITVSMPGQNVAAVALENISLLR